MRIVWSDMRRNIRDNMTPPEVHESLCESTSAPKGKSPNAGFAYLEAARSMKKVHGRSSATTLMSVLGSARSAACHVSSVLQNAGATMREPR